MEKKELLEPENIIKFKLHNSVKKILFYMLEHGKMLSLETK